MALEGYLQLETLVAEASLATAQYKIVAAGAADFGMVVATGGDDSLVGVLQEDPASGEAGAVATGGVSKVKRGAGTVAVGDWVTSDASGRAVRIAGLTEGDEVHVLGQVRATYGATNADEIISVAVRPHKFVFADAGS